MPSLSRDNRKLLENNVVAARSIAEKGAEKALISLGVGQREAPDSLTQQERILRKQLRAHGRQLGDSHHPGGGQETRHLTQAVAYEHWHRMLFARFLAENDLLIHPEYGIAMSMDEVREAAREQGADWLSLAMNCAQHMLIEVFRTDDPVLGVALPPETRLELEQKLEQLAVEVFTAHDSLGWVYQFWQRDEKERVNKSEVKIGADELAPVTQLFTEDYMVLFLLHNTLGAWWTVKRRAEGKSNELPDYEWTYLRLNDDNSPAAGTFEGWPTQLSEIRVLDPCMGSGHFLTFALPILTKMAELEYRLTTGEAVRSVLIENLYGLELDVRCSQIAAFNLALTAWRNIGRYVPLPPMNLACSGLGINASKESWVALARGNALLKDTLEELYDTFQKAPTLGSLLNPAAIGKPLLFAKFDEVWPLLERALAAEQPSEESRELAVVARGILSSARILADKFTLVITNPPYLVKAKQGSLLRSYCESYAKDACLELAMVFMSRFDAFCAEGGTHASVTPQNWLFLKTYTPFRRRLLRDSEVAHVSTVGSGATATASWDVLRALTIVHRRRRSDGYPITGVETDAARDEGRLAELKANVILRTTSQVVLASPNSRISLGVTADCALLATYADSLQGLSTGDNDRFRFYFWEVADFQTTWGFQQGTVSATSYYSGKSRVIRWESGDGAMVQSVGSAVRGLPALGRYGIAVTQMRSLPATIFLGTFCDTNAAVIVPRDQEDICAIWAYCSSPEFVQNVRSIDKVMKVTNATLGHVPFDANRWRDIAKCEYPDGLPRPHTDDPAQWLFDGDPCHASLPLQVAVARLVGYRWPRQAGCKFLDCPEVQLGTSENHADPDGIVCLSSIAGKDPAALRLRKLLEEAFGPEWSSERLTSLLNGTPSLEHWLMDRFFAEHCDVFQCRPFVWHVWDGRNDGFHALVNYHKLAGQGGEGKRTLEKLIYSSLGDWIGRQRAEVSAGADGAESRLLAASHLQAELERILVGEPPYDIFVRWKPLREQPMGWEPDINDGVRLNIRPWLTARPYQSSKQDACVLRVTPIKPPLGKDRGKEQARDKADFPWFADGRDRTNDVHVTLEEKGKARERKKS